jgi:uncharacterized protein (TIGR02466 family)
MNEKNESKLNYFIEEIFPCPIYIVDNCCDYLLEDLGEACRKEIDEYSLKTNEFFLSSTHTRFKELNYYPFQNLKQYITQHSLVFLEKQGMDIKNIELNIGMWCNLSENGSFLFPHTHPGSILSGVFYVKTSDQDILVFYDSRKLFNNLLASNTTRISANKVEYKCNPGTLLMWNSDLLHGNPRRDSHEEKIAISFNITIR